MRTRKPPFPGAFSLLIFGSWPQQRLCQSRLQQQLVFIGKTHRESPPKFDREVFVSKRPRRYVLEISGDNRRELVALPGIEPGFED